MTPETPEQVSKIGKVIPEEVPMVEFLRNFPDFRKLESLNNVFCPHHTDAERAAITCPVCAVRERDEARADSPKFVDPVSGADVAFTLGVEFSAEAVLEINGSPYVPASFLEANRIERDRLQRDLEASKARWVAACQEISGLLETELGTEREKSGELEKSLNNWMTLYAQSASALANVNCPVTPIPLDKVWAVSTDQGVELPQYIAGYYHPRWREIRESFGELQRRCAALEKQLKEVWGEPCENGHGPQAECYGCQRDSLQQQLAETEREREEAIHRCERLRRQNVVADYEREKQRAESAEAKLREHRTTL